MRTKILAVLMGGLLVGAAAVPLVAAGSTSNHTGSTSHHIGSTSKHEQKPAIKTAEVGYFGNDVVARELTVFVYSNLGPAAGNHVTVCLGGKCEAAHGHNAKLAWYSASFNTAPLHMGDPVKFTATASNAAGRAKLAVTKGLLCMHNDGSTPQT